MYHSTIQFSFDKLHSSLVTWHLFCVFYSAFMTIIFYCFKITHYCVVPEIIHISPMEGTFVKIPPEMKGGGGFFLRTPVWKFELSFTQFLYDYFFWSYRNPHPLKIPIPSARGMGGTLYLTYSFSPSGKLLI